MHIALVTAEFPPVWGGSGAFAFYLAKSLSGFGHEVLIITRDVRGEPPKLPGVKVVRLKDTGLRLFSPRLFGKQVKDYVASDKQIDVLHLFYPLLAISKKEFSAICQPTVATMSGSWHGEKKALRHNSLRDLTMNDLAVKLLGKFLKQYETAALKSSTRVTTISNFSADEFRKHYPRSAKNIEVVPIGVNTDIFRPKATARPDLNQELDLDSCACLIICVGRLVGRKGIPFLLKAFKICLQKNLNPLTLILVGHGGLKKRIKKLADDLGIVEFLIMKEGLSAEQLATYLAAADLFVLPSLYEAFGMVYLEAMACKTPVIGTNLGSIPEVIADGRDGLLCLPRDPDDLAEKMLFLIGNPTERQRMGKNGHEKVLDTFTWDAIANRYLSIYADALNKP